MNAFSHSEDSIRLKLCLHFNVLVKEPQSFVLGGENRIIATVAFELKEERIIHHSELVLQRGVLEFTDPEVFIFHIEVIRHFPSLMICIYNPHSVRVVIKTHFQSLSLNIVCCVFYVIFSVVCMHSHFRLQLSVC